MIHTSFNEIFNQFLLNRENDNVQGRGNKIVFDNIFLELYKKNITIYDHTYNNSIESIPYITNQINKPSILVITPFREVNSEIMINKLNSIKTILNNNSNILNILCILKKNCGSIIEKKNQKIFMEIMQFEKKNYCLHFYSYKSCLNNVISLLNNTSLNEVNIFIKGSRYAKMEKLIEMFINVIAQYNK